MDNEKQTALGKRSLAFKDAHIQKLAEAKIEAAESEGRVLSLSDALRQIFLEAIERAEKAELAASNEGTLSGADREEIKRLEGVVSTLETELGVRDEAIAAALTTQYELNEAHDLEVARLNGIAADLQRDLDFSRSTESKAFLNWHDLGEEKAAYLRMVSAEMLAAGIHANNAQWVLAMLHRMQTAFKPGGYIPANGQIVNLEWTV